MASTTLVGPSPSIIGQGYLTLTLGHRPSSWGDILSAHVKREPEGQGEKRPGFNPHSRMANRGTSDQPTLADKGRPLPLSFVKYTAQPVVKWETGRGAMYPKLMELPLLGEAAAGSLSPGST